MCAKCLIKVPDYKVIVYSDDPNGSWLTRRIFDDNDIVIGRDYSFNGSFGETTLEHMKKVKGPQIIVVLPAERKHVMVVPQYIEQHKLPQTTLFLLRRPIDDAIAHSVEKRRLVMKNLIEQAHVLVKRFINGVTECSHLQGLAAA